MRIVLRYLWRTITERRFRSLLLALSVALSAALYFASTALTTSLAGMYAGRLQETYGSAEIVVEPHPRFGSPFLAPALAHALRDDIEYAVGVFGDIAYYHHRDTTVPLSLTAIEYTDLQLMNPVALAAENRLLPFRGHKAIISAPLASAYDLEAGRRITLEIGDEIYRFRVAGIAHPTGMFAVEDERHLIIVPRDFMAGLYQARGLAQVLFIKAKQGRNRDAVIAALEQVFRRHWVRPSVSAREAEEWTREITVPLQIMFVLVLATSAFIIYSSFQVITAERLPIIGTFRSIGATRRNTNLVLFIEAVLYGLAGGAAGCILGIAALYVMALWTTPEWIAADGIRLSFTGQQLALSFLLAAALSLASSAIPIIGAARIPVKELILGQYEAKQLRYRLRSVIGAALVLAALGAPALTPGLASAVCAIIAGVAGVVLLAPLILAGAAAALARVARSLPGSVGELAAKNIRANPNMRNSVALLAIGIGGMLMINTISTSAIAGLTRSYRDMRYHVEMLTRYMDRATDRHVRTTPGVSDVYGVYGALHVPISGTREAIAFVMGIRGDRFGRFWRLRGSDNPEHLYSQLDRGRTIIPTYALQRRLGLKLGDTMTLEMARGPRDYRVIGFFHSVMWSGNYALVGERYLKHDGLQQWYEQLYVKAGSDPLSVKAELHKRFSRREPWLRTVAEMEESDREYNRELLRGLEGFALMALAIAVIGVANNLLIAFIERRKSFALLRSVGMEQRQLTRMVFVEALMSGAIGGVAGVLGGFLLLHVAGYVILALRLYVEVAFSPLLVLLFFLVGVTATVLVSVSPARAARRIDLLTALKHE